MLNLRVPLNVIVVSLLGYNAAPQFSLPTTKQLSGIIIFLALFIAFCIASVSSVIPSAFAPNCFALIVFSKTRDATLPLLSNIYKPELKSKDVELAIIL